GPRAPRVCIAARVPAAAGRRPRSDRARAAGDDPRDSRRAAMVAGVLLGSGITAVSPESRRTRRGDPQTPALSPAAAYGDRRRGISWSGSVSVREVRKTGG